MIYPQILAKKVVCPPELSSRLITAVNQIHNWSPDFTGLIARNRLSELRFMPNPPEFLGADHGGQFDGRTNASTGLRANIITINSATRDHMIKIGQLNPAAALGTVKMLADISTPEVFDAALLVHELSHFVDCSTVSENMALWNKRTEVGIMSWITKVLVSEYANTEPCEWFAETMSAYVIMPDKLKAFDPQSFKFMQNVLGSPTRALAQAA